MLCAADPPPLVGVLKAAEAQDQRLGAQWDHLQLVLDLPVALGLVEELRAAEVQLQLRQQVLSALITLTHTHTHTCYTLDFSFFL